MMNERKKIWIFLLLYLLILLGCSAPDSFSEYEDTDNAVNMDAKEPEGEAVQNFVMAEAEDGTSKSDGQWGKRIYVTKEQLQGNILGYSLIRMPPDPLTNMYYEQEILYLVDEVTVGNGIFVSEYMCEVEVFLGNILKEVLVGCGEISSENERYFTEYALQQMKETDWKLLDEDWELDSCAYDRNYRLNTIFGENNYDFCYYFYPEREKTVTEETEKVIVDLSVNSRGQIYEIRTDILTVPAELAEQESYIRMDGLFDDVYQETMIQSGQVSNEKIIWDFEKYYRRFLYPDEVYEQKNEGLLASGNTAASAEEIGKIFIDILESALDTDVAKAVSIDCLVDIIEGKLSYISMGVFPMTREECQRAKDVKEESRERTLVVEKGTILWGKEMVALPVPERELSFMPVSDFQVDTLSYNHYRRERTGEIGGFSDVAEVAGFFGERFLRDIQNDTIEKGEIVKLCKDKDEMRAFFNDVEKFLEDGWEADGQYDCYEIRQNEVAGCMHLRYYFYPQRLDIEKKSGRVMIVDMYLSGKGIESMKLYEFRMEF